jgi:uncharacterized protein (TIGR02246 family)
MISDLQRDAAAVGQLHARILDAWNRQDASAYAESCTDDAIVIGFDGSEMHGRQEIADQLGAIFADHQVASYVGVVRSVRSLGKDVALLHAVVGMVAPGQEDVMPDRNAVQLLLATHTDGEWRAQALQNTPARYDARPEAARALTDELQAQADG